MSKYIFIILALFGLNAWADMHGNMEAGNSAESSMMSSKMDMSHDKSEDGLMGSFSLRYQPNELIKNLAKLRNGGSTDLSYKARIGWKGQVNDAVKWGFSVSSGFEENFGYGLSGINLEQAYVKYNPVEGLYIMAGKSGWLPDFHKAGVFWSEELYLAGVGIKYKHEMENDGKAYVKLMAYHNEEAQKAENSDSGVANNTQASTDTFAFEDLWLKGKVGVQYNTSSVETGVFVGGIYETSTEEVLAQAGLNVGSSSVLPVSVGAFGVASTDVQDMGSALSYNAGVYVGNAGKADSAEMGDFGLAVSYYQIKTAGVIAGWLNKDYVDGSNDNGIATRAQYNAWDNVSLAVKLAYSMGGRDKKLNGLGELMFLF